MTSNGPVNPPPGVNLAITIFALISAALSIIGFICHYMPQKQYADFCDILHDIHSTFSDNDSLWPSDKRARLWQQYRSISANIEIFHYLVTTPWHLCALNLSTAWRLRSLRGSASRLRVELIALSQIRRREELQKTMESSLSQVSTTGTQFGEASTADNTATHAQDAGAGLPAPSSQWWRWNKTLQPTARKTAGGCLPV